MAASTFPYLSIPLLSARLPFPAAQQSPQPLQGATMVLRALTGYFSRRTILFIPMLFLLALPLPTQAAEHDFYRFPLFFGNVDAPNTIIMYDNYGATYNSSNRTCVR